jgi:hypothetical protein
MKPVWPEDLCRLACRPVYLLEGRRGILLPLWLERAPPASEVCLWYARATDRRVFRLPARDEAALIARLAPRARRVAPARTSLGRARAHCTSGGWPALADAAVLVEGERVRLCATLPIARGVVVELGRRDAPDPPLHALVSVVLGEGGVLNLDTAPFASADPVRMQRLRARCLLDGLDWPAREQVRSFAALMPEWGPTLSTLFGPAKLLGSFSESEVRGEARAALAFGSLVDFAAALVRSNREEFASRTWAGAITQAGLRNPESLIERADAPSVPERSPPETARSARRRRHSPRERLRVLGAPSEEVLGVHVKRFRDSCLLSASVPALSAGAAWRVDPGDGAASLDLTLSRAELTMGSGGAPSTLVLTLEKGNGPRGRGPAWPFATDGAVPR